MHERQFRIAHDNPQLVVEVMGDPARQLSDGLQLLRLDKLCLELLALGDVLVDAQYANCFLLLIAEWDLGSANPKFFTTGDRKSFFVGEFGGLGIKNLLVAGPVTVSMFVPAELIIVLADEVFGVHHSRIPRKSEVAAQVTQFLVLPEHPHRHRIDNGLQQLVGVGQFHFRPLALLYLPDEFSDPENQSRQGYREDGQYPPDQAVVEAEVITAGHPFMVNRRAFRRGDGVQSFL